MKEICNGLPGWALYVVWFLVFVWEFYLGTTKFGSTIGILTKAIMPKKEGDKK